MKNSGILFALAAVAAVGSQLLITPHVSAAQTAELTMPSIAFDVVSVKHNKDETGGFRISSPRDGDNITITDMSPHMLVGIAFGFPLHDEIYGLPGWTDREAYDLVAKVSDKDLTAFHELLPMQRNPLLQQVLVSRFHLQYHYDTRVLPAYALAVGKAGAKLTEAATGSPGGSDAAPKPGEIHIRHGEIVGEAVSMTDLARVLSQQIGRPIADKTSLKGNYNFKLEWAPEMSPNSTTAPNAEIGPSLFTALQEQLGLRLESAKVPVRVLVVDHIDRPDLN
jgi:uncharacterized protein (TIGR03435 family)